MDRNTNSICEPEQERFTESFSEFCTPVKIEDPLKFSMSGLLMKEDVKTIHFHHDMHDYVFQILSIWSAWLITLGDDRYPKGSIVMPSLTETWDRKNYPYKGGGTEIDPAPVTRKEWK